MSPTDEALYVTSLREIFAGGILVALTLVIHAFGMIWTVQFSNGFRRRFERVPSFAKGISNLVLAAWLICLVHIVEVMMWAAYFQWKHCFANYSTALYFSFLEYTTVGSAYNLPQNWRLLEGMISTAGLMGFAWSTGVLLTLAQEFQEEQLQGLKQGKPKPEHPAPGSNDPGQA